LHEHFSQTVDALCTELANWAALLAGRTLTSVFIGGGTPTVLASAELTRLLEAVRRHYRLSLDCEITCEANPGTVDRPKFQLLRALGVNRLSLGVQSFQPEELAFLGRIHGVDDVYRAVDAARDAGFDNINLDFIFGLPGQPAAAWAATLEQALALWPEHLSLYSLIVEPNTPLYHWVETGAVAAPDDDEAAVLYALALERLAGAGYVQYEVSNWARWMPADSSQLTVASSQQGKELTTTSQQSAVNPGLASRHNLLYWRNQEYLGVGPGAHSHLRVRPADATGNGPTISRRWSNHKPVLGYVKRMAAGAPVVDYQEELAPRVSMGESMMLGLRLVREGVPLARFRAMHGVDLHAVFADKLARLEGWGLLEIDERRVRLSRHGLMVGNQVFAAFLGD
jgi:oxygen-independent coproporphyrinogen-3 oxidase